ncbi:hypothetical protein HMPREF9713_00399 [Myroides odoratimimus CCUG 12700]|uniref:ornithine cyclodeaminase family protein n=1 Tax=Myroides odoratimimus TaxID=76832 RepID=UPI000353FCB7|nr:hypothetical protein [Myroides odoratimimus]EPH13619.1 hypothetical protein HMPREF9713_00400 [Myroides odoratimimus CCUG 12700]EPH13729.1 hypothetical protein HMPREF9713_00399 [Myroides odoratimimus CCUG 12700]SHL92753.1 ornithine cyclodeaminase/alanine dehydrogenase [Myroides odoratimimus subsp. xuanwuensis]
MNTIKVLNSEDIKQLVSIEEAIETVVDAYVELSNNTAEMPERVITGLGNDYLDIFFKPSLISNINTAGVKLLSIRKQGGVNGHPAIQGLVILIDSENNLTQAIVDGSHLTALRTGGASGVATRYLARKDSSIMALFGAGTQAYTQFEAVCAERPIKKAYLFGSSKNSKSVQTFIEYYKDKSDVEIIAADDLEVLANVDIICTVTPSATPLFKTSHLKKGVHINAAGSYSPTMHELPEDIFMSSSLFVDHKDSCFSSTADILVPLQKALLPEENYKGEIGDLILGKIQGRTNDSEITVFKNVGIAIQDLITAKYAYDKACRENLGTSIEM